MYFRTTIRNDRATAPSPVSLHHRHPTRAPASGGLLRAADGLRVGSGGAPFGRFPRSRLRKNLKSVEGTELRCFFVKVIVLFFPNIYNLIQYFSALQKYVIYGKN